MSYIIPNPQIAGFMSEEELAQLFEWSQQHTSVVEVGCWKGRSTHALLSGCKGPVVAVDHFLGSESQRGVEHAEALFGFVYQMFMENTRQFKNLSVIRMDSIKAASFFRPKSVDMVFIDGDHEYNAIKADLLAWAPIASKFLCGHDLHFMDVKRALNDVGIEYKEVSFNHPYTLWYSEIKQCVQ
jgi:hypothetical protein